MSAHSWDGIQSLGNLSTCVEWAQHPRIRCQISTIEAARSRVSTQPLAFPTNAKKPFFVTNQWLPSMFLGSAATRCRPAAYRAACMCSLDRLVALPASELGWHRFLTRKLLLIRERLASGRGVDFIEYFLCDSSNVDVALTWNAHKQKAPRDARPKALVLFGIFGCGSRI